MIKSRIFFCLNILAMMLINALAQADTGTSTDNSCLQSAGLCEYNALKGVLTGNLGEGVAIICAAYGCYLWLVAQKAAPGIMLLIVGAAIALLPNFMDAMHANLCPFVSSLGGTCANTSFTAGTVN